MRPLKGQRFCFAHSPRTKVQRRAASSRGGRAERVPNAPAISTPANIADIRLRLTQGLADAGQHPNTLQRGMLIARLTMALIKVIEVSDIEGRFETIEERLAEMEKQR
jgi:hypothetical protein